jgi:hypothetical protein
VYKKITMALVIATILTTYISTLTMSNQTFAQPGPSGGGGGVPSGGVPSGGNGGDGYITITLLGQSASNSGYVGHSGLSTGLGLVPVNALNNINIPINVGCVVDASPGRSSCTSNMGSSNAGQTLAGQEAHVGKVLGGITTTIHNILKRTTTGLSGVVITPHPNYYTPHP